MKSNVKKYIVQAKQKTAKWNKQRRKKKTKRITQRQAEWTKRTSARQGGKSARVGAKQRGREIRKAGRPDRKSFRDRSLPFNVQDESMEIEDLSYAPMADGGGAEEMFSGYDEETTAITDQVWFWPVVIGGAGLLVFTMTKKRKG